MQEKAALCKKSTKQTNNYKKKKRRKEIEKTSSKLISFITSGSKGFVIFWGNAPRFFFLSINMNTTINNSLFVFINKVCIFSLFFFFFLFRFLVPKKSWTV